MNAKDNLGGTRYCGLRRELERLQSHLAIERPGRSPLYAERYWDADQLTGSAWAAFARRATNPRCWEEWHVLAGGEGLIRLFGDPAALNEFTGLAESGWLALAGLEQSPEPGMVTLGNDGHLCGWLAAVIETALAAMTPTLRLEYGRWGLTDDEVDLVNEFDPAYWHGDGDERHPAHPFVQTLTRDVFTASADAIACWLEPEHVLTVGARLDDLPIRLPPLDAPGRTPQAATPPLAGPDEVPTREAAAYLKVSVDTLNAHVRAGRLPRRNVSPHGSSRGPFLYKVADLAKLRDGSYQRVVPKSQPKKAKGLPATTTEPDYDDLDL